MSGAPFEPGSIWAEPDDLEGFDLDDIVMEEMHNSRPIVEGREPSITLLYFLHCDLMRIEPNEVLLRAKLAANAPSEVDGLVVKSYDIRPEYPGLYFASVQYGLQDSTAEIEFDTSGGIANVKQSYAQTMYGTGPIFNGLINCHDGRVDGVDVTIPVMTFSETRSLLDVSETYRNFLFRKTGTVNNALWKGFAAGECLFMGSRGRKVGRERWRVQYMFAGSPNIAGLVLGDGITITTKEGWDYLWMFSDEYVDSSYDGISRKAVAAYVDRVYPRLDFTLLGIGV